MCARRSCLAGPEKLPDNFDWSSPAAWRAGPIKIVRQLLWVRQATSPGTPGNFSGRARQLLRAEFCQAPSLVPPGNISGPARQVLRARQAGSPGPPGRFSGRARHLLRARTLIFGGQKGSGKGARKGVKWGFIACCTPRDQ